MLPQPKASVVLALALLCVANHASAARQRVGGYALEPEAVYLATPLSQRVRAFLPESVDLSDRMPPPGNQGKLSSCTAWAVTYAARSYYAAGQQNRERLDERSALSPAYVFNRLSRGNCDQATSVTEVLAVLRDEGAVAIGDFPYIDGECARQPTSAQQQAAASNRVKTWQRLESLELDAIKGQIANGHPVIVPLNLPKSFDRFEGSAVYDDRRRDREFPHAMVIVGYDDKRQAFRFMNSWDTDWGDSGFVWISYRAYVALQMDRAYVIDLPPPPPRAKLVASPVTPAPPLPAPTAASLPEMQAVPPPPIVQKKPPAPPPVASVSETISAPPAEARPEPAPEFVSPPSPSATVTKSIADPVPAPNPTMTTPPVISAKTVPPTEPIKPTPQPAPAPSLLVVPAAVAAPLVPPTSIAPTPKVPPLSERIESQIAALRCARIQTDSRAGRIRLSGFAGDAREVATLRSALLAEPGVTSLDEQIAIKPWPQCEVLLNFASALSAQHGLQARLAGASRSEQFVEGDRMQIELDLPDYPAYLYVTYLQQGGDVLHLIWPSAERPRPAAPRTRMTLGADGRYLIAPPFGAEAVIIVASASPLFIDETPKMRDDRDYLSAFRRAFALRPADNSGARRVQAVMLPLNTAPK